MISKGGSMAHGPGVLLRLFAALVVLMVLALACATWLFFKRPLLLDEGMSRFALGQAGCVRREVASSLGPQTLFEGGSGTPLVLIHGEGDQAGAWTRIVTPLIEDHRIVIPDLAGHGKSAPDTGPLTVDTLVEGLEAVVDETGSGEPVILVGHSLGALVAFTFAERHPGVVAHLIAVNGGPLESKATSLPVDPQTRDEARMLMDALIGSPAESIPGHVLTDIARRAISGPRSRLQQRATSMNGFALNDTLGSFDLPVTLLWGGADELFDVAYAEALCTALPVCELVVLDGCGHWPQRECPVELGQRLRAVLR
jgi:pimeloyl-ACP methyl ester carboxylesterase